MRRLVLLALVGLRRAAGRRLARHGVRRHVGHAAAWRPASARPPPRRPSTSPRSAPRWCPGFSHHTLGNTDWRTVGVLALPGFVGAFAGATLLVNLDTDVAVPVVASSSSRSAPTSPSGS